MSIVVNTIPVEQIEDFALRHELDIEINERALDIEPSPANGTERRTAARVKSLGSPYRYYAHFKPNAEEMRDGMLVSSYGNGSTPEEAIEDYARTISLKRIAIGAYTDSRREIVVPRLYYRMKPV